MYFCIFVFLGIIVQWFCRIEKFVIFKKGNSYLCNGSLIKPVEWMDSSQGTVDPRRRVSFASCSVARKKASILYSDHSGNIAKKLEKDIKVCKSGFKM